jgi:VCBS repeat-containing protein
VPPQVKATVRHGHIILEDVVEWMYQRPAAEDAVKYLRGVQAVANEITIAAKVSSTAIREKIESTRGGSLSRPAAAASP